MLGVQKFRQYLLGCEFQLITDHKPLVTIFHSNKGIPEMAASHLGTIPEIVMAMLMACFTYPYRMNLPNKTSQQKWFVLWKNTNYIFPSNSGIRFQAATSKDPSLHYTIRGWPDTANSIPEKVKPFQ